MRNRNCLIITDIQNDFCPGGALAIKSGDEVIPVVNCISSAFDKVVCTQDWHPQGHISFASTHDKDPYEMMKIHGEPQVLWPDHCVQGTVGAELHKDLDTRPVDVIIRKGTNPRVDSYSTFLENDKTTKTGLQYYLKGMDIKHVFICGLATDYCVFYSALDAVFLGFKVTVIIDACRGVDAPTGNIERALAEMRKKNVRIENHLDVLAGNASLRRNLSGPGRHHPTASAAH